MRWKETEPRLLPGVLALIVTLGAFPSMAAPLTCADILPKPSIYRESFQVLADLNAASKKLITEATDPSIQWEALTLHNRIVEVERLAESYLKSAGIPYTKTLESFTVKNGKGETAQSTGSGLYHLQGSRSGDETARMIEGVLTNPHLKDHPLQIVFDPFYQKNHPNSVGHFVPQTRTLWIGPNVIVDGTMGVRTTLRHESQHYFEQVNILQGKPSLARLSFWESNPKVEFPYSKYLRVDELETHLRDLRALYNEKMQGSKDLKLATAVGSEETMNQTKLDRKEMREGKHEKLQRMLDHSKLMNQQLELALKEGRWEFSATNTEVQFEIVFKGLSGPYSEVRIELLGLLPTTSRTDRTKVEEAMRGVLQWSQQRTLEIENEFKVMKVR